MRDMKGNMALAMMMGLVAASNDRSTYGREKPYTPPPMPAAPEVEAPEVNIQVGQTYSCGIIREITDSHVKWDNCKTERIWKVEAKIKRGDLKLVV